MTDDRLPLAELMAKTGDGDFLRTIAESVSADHHDRPGLSALSRRRHGAEVEPHPVQVMLGLTVHCRNASIN